MDMCVDATGRDNGTFTSDHLGSWTDNNADVRLDVRIAGFTYGSNTSVFDADIGLQNSRVIKNQRIGDDRINRALTTRTLGLTHAIANNFPATELHLLAIDREILFHFED